MGHLETPSQRSTVKDLGFELAGLPAIRTTGLAGNIPSHMNIGDFVATWEKLNEVVLGSWTSTEAERYKDICEKSKVVIGSVAVLSALVIEDDAQAVAETTLGQLRSAKIGVAEFLLTRPAAQSETKQQSILR